MTALLAWAWRVALDWHLPVLFAFLPVIVLELDHLARQRRERWSEERRALRALRAIQAPRVLP